MMSVDPHLKFQTADWISAVDWIKRAKEGGQKS